MKLLLLSDTYSEHTEKWALGLAGKGVKVGLFSFNKASYPWYSHPNITVLYEPEEKIDANHLLTKLAYLKYVTLLRQAIRKFSPDLLHAHYATSYGLLGALSGFHPYIISSWGTDVMKFPEKNRMARAILKYNFERADRLCATSQTISDYIARVTPKEVRVIPFGVDTAVFSPGREAPLFAEGDFVIGSIKPLETLYNIDVIIRSLARLREHYPRLRLLIAGEGSQEAALRKLSTSLGLDDLVKFTGRIPFHEISRYYRMIDVLVNISEYESFGVSVIEAMACEKPVIVTDVGGLREIVKEESLGIRVPPRDVGQTAAALETLLRDPEKYRRMAQSARAHVMNHYNWKDNLDQMIRLYSELMKK